MTEHEASRTLVKSPPELWAECSDAGSLARHLDGFFGEIRITRLEPETAVAWEGDRASGTVRIEPSGWGTRVTLTAAEVAADPESPVPEVPEPDAEPAVEAVADPEPAVVVESVGEPEAVVEAPAPPGRRRLLARVRSLLRPERRATESEPAPAAEAAPVPEPAPEPERPEAAPEPEPEPDPEPAPQLAEPAPPPVDASTVLTAALQSLGQAHHRPFSRA